MIREFAREAGNAADAASAVRDRMRRGERIPGFEHVLYPAGDPRAPRVKTIATIVAAMYEDGHPEPNVDVAIGRSAGWVAHILEQYEAGFVLRPRADRFLIELQALLRGGQVH